MDSFNWLHLWKPIEFVLVAIGGFVLWALSQLFVRRTRVEQLEKRVSTLEQTVEKLPTSERLHRLELEISELSGELKAIAPKLNQVSKLADMLLENELKGSTNANQ